ncbi:lysophospholipid acyltransferase family protein [bacterium]|nr:lysophospholipid acyltransferase family protein [bacterium]
MVRLLNQDTTKYLALLVRGFFKIQEYFTHIVEVNHPDLDSCLYAMWHGNQCAIYGFKDKPTVSVLVSQSRDGDVVAKGIKPMGFKLVRGSKGRSGAIEASMQMIDALKNGERCAMMVDGPRGPAKVVKDGAIKIAKLSGKPIVPVCWYSTNFNWVKLPSWDGLRMPFLDVRLINLYGEPIYVPEDADDEALEKARLQLQNSLEDLDKRIPDEYKKVYWHGLWRRKQK